MPAVKTSLPYQDTLQRVHNLLARTVVNASWSASTITRSLHWLPIRQQIHFKIRLFAFRAKHSIILARYVPKPLTSQATDVIFHSPVVKASRHSCFRIASLSVSVPVVCTSILAAAQFVHLVNSNLR